MEKDAAKTKTCPLFKWNIPFYNRKKKGKEVTGMGAFVNFVYEYANYIILAGMLLQMIIILQVLVKVNRTDRRLQMIQGKVEDYLNAILTEDSGKEEPLVSRQEEQMRDSIEKKRKQQEEAVFNAVLKEIFP